MDQNALTEIATMMADAAKVETLRYFRGSQLHTTSKETSGFDPVTEADKAAERAMRAVLAQHRPQDGILGEEYDNIAGTSGLTWVLDPIDGTRGYMSGTPTWGTLIALHDGNKPILGLIDQPYIGERFIGGLGHSHMTGPLGAQDLKVSNETALKNAVIFTTFPEVGTPQDQAGFEAVAKTCKLTRYGMDCYAYALLASGHIDLVIEARLQAYDIQAPIAVIEAAGGVVTNWSGGRADQGGRVIAAATSQLHVAALDILAAYGA
ncbi:MAG: histidinol-phosphatase [Litoreibacter sp.]